MQDNFNIHEWRLNKAINELNEKKLCKDCGEGYMEEGQCMECGYMEEGATFTDKHDDNPKLKGGQKDLPDEVQAKIVAKEGEDHEVSMAQNSLEAIISAASQLMSKLGDDERNIPGWIQDHITNAENYIEQANQGFHELESNGNQDELNEDMFSNNDSKVKLVALHDKIGAGPFANRILGLNINILDQIWDDISKGDYSIKENLDMNQTQVLAKEVAKALVLALKEENAELSSLKIKNLEPKSFEIYVTYKDGADDEFSFHVDDDKLKLSDFTFIEILGTVDENGNVDKNEVKNNLLKTWAKHIKKDEN